MSMHTELAYLFILIVLSAFFAMSEAALLSLSKFKARYMAEKNRFGAVYVKKLKDDIEMLFATILIGNNLANVAAAAITTSISIRLFESNAIGIATGVATLLILVLGDIVPKTIGANNNEAIAPIVAPVIYNLGIAIYPLIKAFEIFLKGINRIVGSRKAPITTKEELKTIIKVGEEEGSIKELEKRLMHRVFDFENTTVSDVMTTKKFIVYVSAEMQIKDVLQLPTAKMYSRFPVYEKNRENIVGILYLKDMLKFVKDGKFDVQVRQIMKKPLFVFSNKKIDAMLRLFQGRKQHMAIVIDEKAHVVGLVTIENILEEIVGEIIDESDRINPGIQEVAKNEWIVKGSSEIDDVSAKTGIPIKKADYVDLDSFILSTLGRAPKPDDAIEHQNYKIKMEEVQGKKVIRARVVKS